MSRIQLLHFLAVAFVVGLIILPVNGQPCNPTGVPFGGGDGSAGSPYLICAAAQLDAIGSNSAFWNSHFALTTDLDLTGLNLTPIGSPSLPFTGTFDGNGFTLTNLSFNLPTTDHIGLFGYVEDPNAHIQHLGLIDPDIIGEDNVGALVGLLAGGSVTDCYAQGGKTCGAWFVGGLAGFKTSGSIRHSYATSVVSGTGSFAGGLLGYNIAGLVSHCYASGDVTGVFANVGGLIGYNGNGNGQDYALSQVVSCYATGQVTGLGPGAGTVCVGGLAGYNSGTIRDSYATGWVTGNGAEFGGLTGGSSGVIESSYATGDVTSPSKHVGGLVGVNSDLPISDSYATGAVSGTSEIGGLVGQSFNGTISHCFSTGVVTGTDEYVGGLIGQHFGPSVKNFWDTSVNPGLSGLGNKTDPNVIGESTANMQIRSTYTNAGWDFLDETINGTPDTWRLCVDGVRPPHLAWEFPALDFTCPDGYHFIEFAHFQLFWGRSDCDKSNNDCSGADLDRSGTVDLDDLWALALLWLGGL